MSIIDIGPVLSVIQSIFNGLAISNEYGLIIQYHLAITTILVLIAFVCAYIFKSKPKKPWRVSASKRWLKAFRTNKHIYSPGQRFAYIRKVDHFLWEDIIMTCFEERGYPIKRTKMTRDGGSDGYVRINGKWIVIQAKRYSGSIAKAHVIELDRLVEKSKHLDKGLFIHTGKSSGPIIHYCKNRQHMELLSGVDKVLRFLDGEAIDLFDCSLTAGGNNES